MKKIIAIVFITIVLLICAQLAWAGWLTQHPIPGGHLLDAIALENGDAVTLTREFVAGNEVLTIGYYTAFGEMVETQHLPIAGGLEGLIVQVCGQYLQIFSDYGVYAERTVYQLPNMQTCQDRVFIPLVLNEE